jgi:protein-S-isoprenylcysteine O-methyltransferase Ste14
LVNIIKENIMADTKLERSGKQRVVQLIGTGILYGVVLFLAAGRLDWLAGWLFVGITFIYLVIMAVWGIRKDPALLNERGQAIAEVEGGERALLAVVGISQFAMLLVTGLDAGRFQWTQVPPVVQVIGFLLFIPAVLLPGWVMMVNTYATVDVRIQEERGQQVITAGPYKIVRHPMYLGTFLGGISIPLALGALGALIPGLIISAAFVYRTAKEDRMLQNELPGYKEFASITKYRIIPGVW